MTLRRLLCLITLATTACVKQGQVRERPAPELRLLCTDPRYQSVCTPGDPGAPQVDTNLAVPPPGNKPSVG